MQNTNSDEYFMQRCINLSAQAFDNGDNPFGCVIVQDNKIIVEAANKIRENDVTQHAEIIAMRKAQQLLARTDLSDCTLYSNCEPCPMCSFMIRELKFKKVVFALSSPAMGGYSKWPILQDTEITQFKPVFADPPIIVTGVLKKEAAPVFTKAGFSIHE